MFRFVVKFLKIFIIVCIIGVSLRIIDIVFYKEKTTDIANNNEIQYEEKTEVASNEIDNELQKEITTEKTKKEANEEQNKKVEKKENEKIEIKEDKKEKSNNVNLTANTKKENVETSKPVETKKEEKYTEVEIDIAEKKECNSNNHGIGVGNSGKWFNTKDEAIATYKKEVKIWEDKWTTNNEISYDEYCTNCPYGYEIWSCPLCNKWTINYYYDN